MQHLLILLSSMTNAEDGSVLSKGAIDHCVYHSKSNAGLANVLHVQLANAAGVTNRSMFWNMLYRISWPSKQQSRSFHYY